MLKKYENCKRHEMLNKLIYLKQLLNETLRKYPPYPFLLRLTSKDYDLPNMGFALKRGKLNIIGIVAICVKITLPVTKSMNQSTSGDNHVKVSSNTRIILAATNWLLFLYRSHFDYIFMAAVKDQGITLYYALSASSQKELQTLDHVSQAFALLFADIEFELSTSDKEVSQTFVNAQVSAVNEIFTHMDFYFPQLNITVRAQCLPFTTPGI
uniref:Uncharacterized protein n=1 Tax=Glossina pallidipes TaxID=7398 RepID=A0A1B0A639_GLOPL